VALLLGALLFALELLAHEEEIRQVLATVIQ